MDSLQRKHRTIIEDTGFKDQLKKLRISHRRLDELMENGVAFALCREPEVFPGLPGSTVRRIRVLACVGIPDCNIWFSYDDEKVTLVAIDLLEE